MPVKLTDCIAPSYYGLFNDLEKHKHIHYWLKGGRGSLKSSFAFIYTIWSMTRDALEGKTTHCVALRKVKDTIKDSVFTNLLWAIDMLGLSSEWKYTTSPMKLWYGDSTILFRGCSNRQDYEKIKSIKVNRGYIKYSIFEELTEFNGIDEIRSILQSIFRGGDEAIAFYMYNPPPSKSSWVNAESKTKENNRLVHHSTYLTAPKAWLGDIFLQEAEQLRKINPRRYNHMYLGEEIGEGLEIYPNVTIRAITEDEIASFTQVNRGLDFGYSHASCYSETYYDSHTDKVYVFDEVYGYKMNNTTLANAMRRKAGNHLIRADSEDPRTINEMKLMGLNMVGAKKGRDSKPHGIKWLSDRVEIVIDRWRCPNIASDFELYEFKKDKEGNKVDDYPEEPDGSASVRYSLEPIILKNKFIFGGRR